jgi:hypothetical protein
MTKKRIYAGSTKRLLGDLTRTVRALRRPLEDVIHLGYAYARAGMPHKAETILTDLNRRRVTSYIAPTNMALIRLGWATATQA